MPIFHKNISFKKIKHSDLLYYLEEGYGGKDIREWPVYNFFKLYLHNQESEAFDRYTQWYMDQLSKYCDKPSHEGGMYKGSLYNLIENRCNKKFNDCTSYEIETVVRERVTQRLSIIKSIKDKGYNIYAGEKVYAVKKNDYVYLLGGHHRAAALLALGEEEMPGILVFPNMLVYNMFSFLRKIKKYAKISK